MRMPLLNSPKESSEKSSARWFYLAIGSVAMLFMGLIYGWSVFVTPLEENFGWERAQTSMVFTISMASYAVGSISAGFYNRKHNGSVLLAGVALIYLIGFGLCSMVNELYQIYLFYGVLCGLATGAGYNTVVSMVTGWFPERLGLASGILMMGYGLGAFALGSLVSIITEAMGFRMAFRVLAVGFALIILLTAIFLKSPTAPKKAQEGEKQEKTGLTPGQMLVSGPFIRIFIWSTLICSIGMMIFGNAKPFSRVFGADEALSLIAVGLVSISNGVGRILYGTLFDRLGIRRCLPIPNLFAAASAGFLLAGACIGNLPLILAGFVCSSLAYSAMAPLSTTYARQQFGKRYYSTNFSIFCTNGIPASLLGASLTGVLLTRTGSYAVCFGLACAAALIALGLLPAVRKDIAVGK